MKILFVNFTKMVGDTGGVAKVACAFANEMIQRGHEVSMVYSDEKEGPFFFPVSESFHCYNVKKCKDGKIIKFPWYMKLYREMVRCFDRKEAQNINRDFDGKKLTDNLRDLVNNLQPDVIVSYQIEGTIHLLWTLKIKIPVITMSHGAQRESYDEKETFALEHSKVYQVLTEGFKEQIHNVLPNVNVVTIGNAIPIPATTVDLTEQKERYKVIFVGRLNRNHKRPHLLIQAFAKLSTLFPNWDVELWGAEDRKEYTHYLKKIISDNGLDNRVILCGATDKVGEKLLQADIFAFPSAYEGFGMALAEGMSVGLPCVGYKSCPAVNELIEDGVNGYLCDDGVDAFADALSKLMSNQDLRIRMGRVAREKMQQYEPRVIWDKWEELLRNVVQEGV